MQYPAMRFTCECICCPRRIARSLYFSLLIVLCFGLAAQAVCGQSATWTQRIADATLHRQAAGQRATAPSGEWSAETGQLLEGMEAAWYDTADGDYFRYARQVVDAHLNANGAAASAASRAGSLDDGLYGRQLLRMYRVTLDPKYYAAAQRLRQQLLSSCGAYLAGSGEAGAKAEPENRCMAQPFLAEYALVFQEPEDFARITQSFVRWSGQSGQSWAPHAKEAEDSFAMRDAAWLVVNLVDSLQYYPLDNPGRAKLTALLRRTAAEVAQHEDRATGLWYQTPGGPAAERRLMQPRDACMFAYALMKGVRLGYLPATYSADAERAWHGIQERVVQVHDGGEISLAGKPGSNGDGALLLAATEADLAPTAALGRGATVLLDAWYNSQQRTDAAGKMDYFHYKWADFSNSGYSLFGHLWRSYGAATGTLYSAPTHANLSKAQFYVIASPDIPARNPNPHYMTVQDAGEIAIWVKRGGVLILMENDPPNADIAHLDLLADRFGIHFDNVLTHHIIGEQVGPGRIPVVVGSSPVFHHAHTLYMKDTCTISLRGKAAALLQDREGIVMATAKYGRGTVFASVDPWLYNEYTDGRKNAAIYGRFDNFAGGRELVQWLLRQRPEAGRGANEQ